MLWEGRAACRGPAGGLQRRRLQGRALGVTCQRLRCKVHKNCRRSHCLFYLPLPIRFDSSPPAGQRLCGSVCKGRGRGGAGGGREARRRSRGDERGRGVWWVHRTWNARYNCGSQGNVVGARALVGPGKQQSGCGWQGDAADAGLWGGSWRGGGTGKRRRPSALPCARSSPSNVLPGPPDLAQTVSSPAAATRRRSRRRGRWSRARRAGRWPGVAGRRRPLPRLVRPPCSTLSRVARRRLSHLLPPPLPSLCIGFHATHCLPGYSSPLSCPPASRPPSPCSPHPPCQPYSFPVLPCTFIARCGSGCGDTHNVSSLLPSLRRPPPASGAACMGRCGRRRRRPATATSAACRQLGTLTPLTVKCPAAFSPSWPAGPVPLCTLPPPTAGLFSLWPQSLSSSRACCSHRRLSRTLQPR